MKHILDTPAFARSWFLLGISAIALPFLLFILSRLAGSSESVSSFKILTNRANSLSDDEYFSCSFIWGCSVGKSELQGAFPYDFIVFGVIYTMTVVLYLRIILTGISNPHRTAVEQAPMTIFLLTLSGYTSIGMFLFAGSLKGLVSVDGKEFNRHGWFGQIGVLYLLTILFWSIFSFSFTIIIKRKVDGWCFSQVDTIDDYNLHSKPEKTAVYLPAKKPHQPRRIGRSDSMPGKIEFGRASTQRANRIDNPWPFMAEIHSMVNMNDLSPIHEGASNEASGEDSIVKVLPETRQGSNICSKRSLVENSDDNYIATFLPPARQASNVCSSLDIMEHMKISLPNVGSELSDLGASLD